jgi:hypothetical protein
MLKPADLRAHLTAAVPQLARDPEKLIVIARGGRIVCTATGTLSFEYRYTLQAIALDYAGHADALMVPLLAWVHRNQPEILDNPKLREESIRFDVEYLTADTVDIAIEIDLTERALVRPRAAADPGALEIIHPPEPLPTGWVEKPEHWALYLRGYPQPLAEWDIDPRPLT